MFAKRTNIVEPLTHVVQSQVSLTPIGDKLPSGMNPLGSIVTGGRMKRPGSLCSSITELSVVSTEATLEGHKRMN